MRGDEMMKKRKKKLNKNLGQFLAAREDNGDLVKGCLIYTHGSPFTYILTEENANGMIVDDEGNCKCKLIRVMSRDIREFLGQLSWRNVKLYYIGLNSPELAVERVKDRVAKGGHGIPEDTIKKRYEASLDMLTRVLPLCNRATIYDNSIKLDKIARYKDGK